jgi:hypothetical protein
MSKSANRSHEKTSQLPTKKDAVTSVLGPGQVKYGYGLITAGLYLLAALAMKFIRGPYYTEWDPNYAYLFNMMNVVVGQPIDHIDHPGTTLHGLGALIISATKSFSAYAEPTIQRSVILHPELHLHVLNAVILLLVLLASLGLYRSVRRAGVSIKGAILVQAFPLFFFEVHNALWWVKPEPLLIAMIMAIGSLLILEYTKTYTRKWTYNAMPVGLGILAGLAFMLKITAAPLVLLFLFPRKLWRKGACLGAMAVTCGTLFTLLLPKLKKMENWYSSLLFNKGIRGKGEPGMPSVPMLVQKSWELALETPVFALTVVILLILALWYFLFTYRKDAIVHGKQGFALDKTQRFQAFLVILTVIAQIALVLRHPRHTRYFLPAMALLPILFCIIAFAVKSSKTWLVRNLLNSRHATSAACLAGLAIAISLSQDYLDLVRTNEAKRHESAEAETVISRYPEAIIAVNPWVGNKYTALFTGNQWAGFFYGQKMEKLMGKRRPLIFTIGYLWTYAGAISPQSVLNAVSRDHKTILIKTRPYSNRRKGEVFNDRWMRLKTIMQGEHVGLYKLVGPSISSGK